MSKEQIEVITYEQDRLYFFVDQVSLAQKKYDRLFKTFKDAPYLSEGAQFLSDAGRELQFYKDVVEMLDKGYRKQSEWISVEERLPESSDIECLLFLDNEQIVIGWYHVSAGVFVEGGIAMLNKVAYWMPLPEAPKMKGGTADA